MKNKSKKLILALGESTHTHILNSEKEVEYYNETYSNDITFSVKTKSVISHEEHANIVLNPGNYYKVNQVEYDPFTDLVRAVFD